MEIWSNYDVFCPFRARDFSHTGTSRKLEKRRNGLDVLGAVSGVAFLTSSLHVLEDSAK